jgi:hypothetical protein
MLTPDEVRAVPLFASLPDADLDRLVRTSADIRLNPGEYAVHEGGERALYAVAIIGGGIGGLFAANALIAQGLLVSVAEQASSLGEIGAGVFVTPNAVRHLERVGLGPAVEKWGARVGPGSWYFRHDGTPIARCRNNGPSTRGARRYLRQTVTFQLSMPCTVGVVLACAKRTNPNRIGGALAEKSGHA